MVHKQSKNASNRYRLSVKKKIKKQEKRCSKMIKDSREILKNF